MKMMRILPPLALTVFSAAAAAGPAGYAPPPVPDKIYGAGTVVGRIGISYIHPLEDEVTFADRFFFDDPLDNDEAFRARVDPDDEWGWNVSGMWFPIDHFALELSFVWGNEHEGGHGRGAFARIEPVFLGDPLFFDNDFAEFESRKSQAMINWFPLDPSCMFQPYIGVGINYTDFHEEDFTLFDGVIFDEFGPLTGDLDLGHSWGYAWQVGADWVFGRESAWLVNAAAIWVDSETEMGFDIYSPGVLGDGALPVLRESFSGDYRYNPWTFNLSIGYKFTF
ncbi:OmpW/AlkL family protein [Microbulbifer rhizosphaerae]|uniref:Outer membrane protein n=1 Tax=Microbulbifer rhizosphaerae TaxID=1562603 RepID=A0A7W4WAW9_9GAMM|nr:OmpW family outer membrane protein [Microbulbifer rhizosphaerae]MBB3060900.1 outer membrane protein [Microbulbifer rhizosphaerae]